ncbi:MAG: flippase [Cyanobacteria bacterium P01_G01_bin.19]
MNLKSLKLKFSQITKKSIFKDTSWILIARLINVVIQAAYFIILARTLGAENYGSFVGISALASLLSPFVPLGSDDILVKRVSVDRAVFPTYWGNALLILLVNSTAISIFLLLISRFIFPENIPLFSIGFILFGDLLCLNLQDTSNKAMRSVGLMQKAAQLIVLSTLGKLLAILGIITFLNGADLSAEVNIETWSIFYFLSSFIISLFAILTINKMVGKPQLMLSRIKSDIRQGIYFSLGMSANNINNNIDKTMLVSMATLDATGVYGSAYRFINIGDVPMLSMFNATYPRFFQYGSEGWDKCLNFAKKLLPVVFGYGVIGFIGFQVFAPVVPKVLGAEYENVIPTLRWLAPLPLISGLQLLISNTLTGLGHQKARSIIQTISAGANVLLNLWLIPLYGLYGAIWATLASDTARVICLTVALFHLYGLSKQKTNNSRSN